jgi:hypothetical protein
MGSVRLGESRRIAAQEAAAAEQVAAVAEPIAGPREFPGSFLAGDAVIAFSLAAVACLVHLLCSGRYGYFRDELYYIACGQHLAWGYVDQPPLIAVWARFSVWLLGDSLSALRFFPALASAAKILLTAWMVRELGGKRFAQLLAGTAVFLAPIYLTFDSFLSMNAFEPLFWTLCAALAMRIAKQGNCRLWVLFGLIAGLGLLNKHSMLFFGFGMVLALLLMPQRRAFRSRWIWLGGLVAFLIVLPNLLWEIRHGWPTLEHLHNVALVKHAPVTPLQFVLQQALLVLPLAAPICLAGLYFFLRADEGKPYRFLGWTYLLILAQLILLKGKIYYLAPIYPMLFAAGAVWIEQWTRLRNWNWMKPAILVPLAVGGLVAAPLALPVLPVEAMAAYSKFWKVDHVRVERQPVGKLPQLWADMFGWKNQVATIARAYHRLPVEEQSKCALLAWNYGEAGAIDHFGAAYGLPKAISGSNNYYLWGPRGYSGEVVISLGVPLDRLQQIFGQIEQADLIVDEYAMPDESDLPVYICRKPKLTLQQAWPGLKLYQ